MIAAVIDAPYYTDADRAQHARERAAAIADGERRFPTRTAAEDAAIAGSLRNAPVTASPAVGPEPVAADPLVSVFPHKRVRGWPRWSRGHFADVCPLSAALSRTYATDAHFCAYTSNGRRLTREALDRGRRIELSAAVFDIDCPAVHGSAMPAPDEWRAALLDQVAELTKVHPDPLVYMTRGGARIVYTAELTVLTSQVDAQRWSQHYMVACAYLGRRFGIVADPACKDWQRFYRLPHATREPGGQPERWPEHGDPKRIGVLMIEATRADVDAARCVSSVFVERRVLHFEPCTSSGFGLLYHLLSARGAIIRPHSGGGHIIRCPRESAHSTGNTGDGSTVLYPPARGKSVGAIACLHGHCSHMRVQDWLALFSEQELASAHLASSTRCAG